jgi:hypothetical protein
VILIKTNYFVIFQVLVTHNTGGKTGKHTVSIKLLISDYTGGIAKRARTRGDAA